MELPRKYTAAQLREAAKLGSTKYDQWKSRGFIKSSEPVVGSGNPQLYSAEEVLRTALLSRLVSFGLTPGASSLRVGGPIMEYEGPEDTYFVIVAELAWEDLADDSPDISKVRGFLRRSKAEALAAKHEGGVLVNFTEVRKRVENVLGEPLFEKN